MSNFIFPLAFAINIISFTLWRRSRAIVDYEMRVMHEIRGIVRPEVAIPLIQVLMKMDFDEILFQFWKPIKSFYPSEINKLLE